MGTGREGLSELCRGVRSESRGACAALQQLLLHWHFSHTEFGGEAWPCSAAGESWRLPSHHPRGHVPPEGNADLGGDCAGGHV